VDIAEKVETTGFQAPAVAVFGDVVSRRGELNWFESKPLFGKRVVVTRTRKQAGVLSRQLAELGADVYELPTIRIDPPKDQLGFGELVLAAHEYDWIIFTSPNGAEAFFELFYKIYEDARSIGGVKIAAMGPGTAAKIKEYRIGVDLIPKKSVAEGLVEALVEEMGDLSSFKMLWVKAEETRDVLSKSLTDRGVILDEAIAYRTVPETTDRTGAVERFRSEGADVITFTSSSTVEHFLDLRLPLPDGLKIASIGPITSQTLEDHGMSVDIEAEEYDIPGLVRAVVELCRRG
jgi:uroporphyrinogen III methyltransferase/synthase